MIAQLGFNIFSCRINRSSSLSARAQTNGIGSGCNSVFNGLMTISLRIVDIYAEAVFFQFPNDVHHFAIAKVRTVFFECQAQHIDHPAIE